MNSTLLLPGITQQKIRTNRLETAYLEAGSGEVPVVLLHGNCSSSLFFQDLMLALAARGYKLYAPDMRGYGDSEGAAVDATRGMRDFSDDFDAFVHALGLPAFHLLGWSLGGNIAMQYAIDHPGTLRTLLLQAPGSPFGFCGTKGPEGTPVWPDFAGSGGGVTNPEFVKRLAEHDRGSEQFSPRTVINTLYYNPPFHAPPEREELYLTSLLLMKVGPGNYPGDSTPSSNWPFVAPGTRGPNNALSPKYMNQASFATISSKPPVLWIHGTDDKIVSDTSLSDIGFLGQLGAVPGWPGAEVYPPQPMVTQIRAVLDRYQANGGQYHEATLQGCGHSPHIERPEETLTLLTDFMAAH